MPTNVVKNHLLIDDLSKGMNTYDPITRVPKGFYVDAQNMVLTNKAPITIGGLTKFNITAAPNSETIVWFEPYTPDGSSVTHMLVATSAGTLYKYVTSTDTWTILRTGLSTTALTWSHVPFRGTLVFSNGTDPVFKYDGSIVIPVGSTSIATMESDETWSGGLADTTYYKQGVRGRRIITDGSQVVSTSIKTFGTAKDLLTGLGGGTDFGSTDLLEFKLYVPEPEKFTSSSALQFQLIDDPSSEGSVNLRQTAASYDYAVAFTPATTFTVGTVNFEMRAVGSPSQTYTCEIQTDSAGAPDNTAISGGTSGTVAASTISSTLGWVSFSFASLPSVTGGTAYWLVVKGNAAVSASEYVVITTRPGTGTRAVNSSGAPTVWAASSGGLQHQVYSSTGSIEVRFHSDTSGSSNYYTMNVQSLSSGWQTVSKTKGQVGSVGNPTWETIWRVEFRVRSDVGTYVVVDDMVQKYALSPPAGKYVELYSQQLVVGGISSDPVAIQYSDAGVIDEFPADNVARFSGGRNALEKTDQITSLRSYFDELIVGKVNSAWTFSGTGTNVSISALPLTIGIDGHNAIVETPWSLHFLFENNIFGARLTSRGIVSSNVSSLLEDIDGASLDKTTTIRHDRTRTIRWAFRTSAGNGSNDLGLIYDYQADAWPSRYTPKISYYTRGIIDGVREILCAQYDGYIRRVDVGTTFDGTAIESYVTLPYVQTENSNAMDNVTRWVDWTVYLKGTADVLVEARFADEPHEFDTATFTTFGTITATPDGDKGYGYFGRTARWVQLRLRATAGAFEVLLPLVLGYSDTMRRV